MIDLTWNRSIPNDGTCFRRNIFSSPRHRIPFKLKSHYNRDVCVWWGGGKSRIAKMAILPASPAYLGIAWYIFSHRQPCFLVPFAHKRFGGNGNMTHCCKSLQKTTARFSSNPRISFLRKSTRKDPPVKSD